MKHRLSSCSTRMLGPPGMNEPTGNDAVCAAVVALFRGVLEDDPGLLARLRSFPGDIWLDRGGLRFRLPALHAYLYGQQPPGYSEFRRALYSSDLNTRLGALGAQVVIHRNEGKVDQSIYRLQAASG